MALCPLAGTKTTSSPAAALSAAGRTKLTVAQVGITDDTVTLAGTANLGMTCEAPDNSTVVDGLEAALMATASARGAAMTAGAAIHHFFIWRSRTFS